MQWNDLKSYCNAKGIEIIGDMPIYVSYDSVDVWANPELFQLDQKKGIKLLRLDVLLALFIIKVKYGAIHYMTGRLIKIQI